ncbi:hypothetical protein GCM10011415_04150 [Salipiger pallidus]|uniref:D-galactarate dehydratase n=1 Tax=Salipiger pallidus TaxID=1775170 RepID=A0A8J2ZGH2_9RHOB|nr:hypothetical protein [Salipiger pallidus]GGG61251.1 hypothetical protein GCM10011415_04150 [Salipiger pallidus]
MFDKTPDAAPASVTAPPAGDAPTSPAAEAIRPPAGARTVDQFDTTSAEERAAASAPSEPAGERSLGTTVASLGDPSRSGFWLETPLVTAEGKGRVVYNGKSAQVDLIPIAGPATGGSRLSLAAMRLIEAPLTDLPTVEVYTGG